MNSANFFRDGVCIATPFGYCVHYFSDLNFCLCPDDATWAAAKYQPGNVAHWLVTEALDELLEPGYRQLEIELPAQGEDW
jgi:hypothetical protein